MRLYFAYFNLVACDLVRFHLIVILKSHTDAELVPVSPGDTTPLINYSVIKHDTKEASNISTNEPLTVDKPISLCDEVQP